MARIYSRKKGKSGSKKPFKPTKHVWLSYTPKEVEQLIVRLAKGGKTSSEIGIMLRDTYGIPSVKETNKSTILKILEANNLKKEIPDELIALMKKKTKLAGHIESNKKDEVGRRGFLLTESRIRRLIKYYKRAGKLPSTWEYGNTIETSRT